MKQGLTDLNREKNKKTKQLLEVQTNIKEIEGNLK
jgi:hypothetical protein